MKAKREQVDGDLLVIKLFASNYARDLLYMIQQIGKRTEPKDIIYYLHIYFNGLSLRHTSKAISRFITSHTAIRDWIQKYKPAERLSYSKTKTSEFILVYKKMKLDSKYVQK